MDPQQYVNDIKAKLIASTASWKKIGTTNCSARLPCFWVLFYLLQETLKRYFRTRLVTLRTALLGMPDWTLADIVQEEKERYLQTVVLPVLIAVSILQ